MSAMASRITGDSAVCSTACTAYNIENIKAPDYRPFVRESTGFPKQMVNAEEFWPLAGKNSNH